MSTLESGRFDAEQKECPDEIEDDTSPNGNEETKAFLNDQPSNFVRLTYSIDDNPPWYMSLFLGFQHYLTMFGGTVALPLLIAKFLCVGNNGIAKSQLICTIFFASGIATLLQSTVGVRLPIIQGGTFSFLAPTIAILTLPKWRCPETLKEPKSVQKDNSSCWKNVCTNNKALDLPSFLKDGNDSSPVLKKKKVDPDAWKERMREVQGAIIVASLFQVIIGATGTMGFLMKYIGPLTVTPSISLIGLSLFDVGADHASKHWGIAILTIALVILFSQYLKNLKVPLPAYSKANGVYSIRVALFELFPVLFAVVLAWFFCIILTAAGSFEKGHAARTDKTVSLLHDAPWFRIPYPGQWGTPTVSVASVIGMIAGVMAGMIESVGDYYACARLAGAPAVPQHAINRGILIEGLCCVLAGAFGSGTGTTSYSENIGAIGITKVGSRRVIQFGGIFMVVLAVLGKFGALFATIPEPIIGGVFIIMFGMVTAVGLSNLQFVDLNSARNLFILGFSIFIGLVVPKWVKPRGDAIDTGSEVLDSVLYVLLTTGMWVGGMVGLFLDVTLSGTDEERGILKWRKTHECQSGEVHIERASIHTYDIPFLTSRLQKFPIVRHVPFLPYYGEKEDIEDLRNGKDAMMDNESEKKSKLVGEDGIETVM
ncbi:solute carrier family 23 member 1-like [Dendronephthya gigantea]|uniref:solute carrier family 23 member 1-like n=1 Tax=Dendronephthya gigantea TaxID=151771 RepID=UPI001068F746|nr:solute carrier family 23 member 1-like [Dendronephthya gigantea]